MGFYLPFIFGLIVILGLTVYFVLWYSKKKAKSLREGILSGNKPFLAHWKYEDINIADFQNKLSSILLYKRKLTAANEVYICNDGVLIGESIYMGWGSYSHFHQLEIIQKGQPCIQFKIEYGSNENATFADFVIPVPKGKEQEAESVVETLRGMVRFRH